MGKWAAKLGKWNCGLVAVLLFCVPIWIARSEKPEMLQDTDTKVLLHHLRERQDPLSWFTGDWPLGNHFYRPISTLSFELDNALYGDNAYGYGRTNALVAIACVLLLFWFLRELTDRLEIALPGAVLFSLWTLDRTLGLDTLATWLGWASLGLLFAPGRRWGPVLLASATLIFLGDELSGIATLRHFMIEWLPGRTASVMTLFALLSLAAYARYERLSAAKDPKPAPGPLDPPATKSTELRSGTPRLNGLWPVVSILCLALALGSYEQAVMVPGLLVATALCLRLQRYRVRWAWQAAFWGVLAGYLALRHNLVPSDVSGYQAQQFRSGDGVWRSLLEYLFPAAPSVWHSVLAYDFRMLYEAGGFVGATLAFPFPTVVQLAANCAVILVLRREWRLPVAGWAMSFVAFLPMAWLKHFDHYHYLPMAMRALFVGALIGVAGKALVSAASRPELRAPPRLYPAPGSLPRP